MFQLGVFSNRWLWLGVAAMLLLQPGFAYLPWMNLVLNSVPIGLDAWGRVLAVALMVYLVVEIEKRWRRR